jgi:hypothetical protein
VQGALSPIPDWKGGLLANPSQQVWLEQNSSSLGVAYPINQPEA